jgi:hypothetical protein
VSSDPVYFGAPTSDVEPSAALAPRRHTMGPPSLNRRNPSADRVCVPYGVDERESVILGRLHPAAPGRLRVTRLAQPFAYSSW